MKNTILLLLLMTLLACDKNDTVNPTNNDIEPVTDFLRVGNGLLIVLLTDDEVDETNYFDSYVFNFGSDGSVVAADSNNTVNGTYSVFSDDGRIELRMNFPNTQKFGELNDDWYFISINQNTIRFDDDGDILEFQQK